MSAELLREAAAKMRERAATARAGVWFSEGVEVAARWRDPRSVALAYGSDVPEGNVANAEHIASWHPAVALAVADWLDAEATASDALALFSTVASEIVEYDMRGAAITVSKSDDGAISMRADTCAPALAVARAYLGVTA